MKYLTAFAPILFVTVACVGEAVPPASPSRDPVSQVANEPDPAQNVARKLSLHQVLSRRRLDVTLEGATVVLTGTVNSPVERTLADQWARETPGVDAVRNEIHILGSGAPDEQLSGFSGARLEDAVEEVFRLTRGFDDVDIDVRGNSAGVQLSGIVKSEAQKERAEALARAVVSVQNVVNDLRVGS